MSGQRYTVKPAILTGGRNVSKETGKAIVYIRVTTFQHGEKPKSKYNRTHITVKPKDFDKKEGKVKRSDLNASDKNYQIYCKKVDVEQEIKNVNEDIDLGEIFGEDGKEIAVQGGMPRMRRQGRA